MNFKIIIVVTFALTVIAKKTSYADYKLYKVIPKTAEEIDIINNIKEDYLGDVWEDHIVVGNDIKVMVRKENESYFLERINHSKIEYKLLVDNLQDLIDEQMKASTGRDSSFLSFNWEGYHDLDTIYNWLDEVAAAYPDVASTVVMGPSVENRNIKGIIINYKPDHIPNYGVIEGTLHAREWISAATVTWIIKEFLTSTDPSIRFLAENIEWHIFPVVNPDGYTYTFTHNRMWRKNRSTENFTSCNATQADDDMSNGVDLNRNFDYAWNTSGVSQDPCSNTYPGPTAMSEPETRAIIRYVSNLEAGRGWLSYYIAFHSYTQLIVVPYSDLLTSEAILVTNYGDMYEVAIRSADKMRQKFGSEYTVGISGDIMYPMSGTSFDWVKQNTRVPVSYLIELRDLGEYGFLLPPAQIIPTGHETMDFLVEMDQNVRNMHIGNFPISSASSVVKSLMLVLGAVVITFIY